MGFSFFSPLFCSFLQSCFHFLLHYSAIPAVMSFGLSLLGFFGLAACSSLNDSAWSLGFFLLHYLRAPVSHLFPLGHPWPICFPWASLAYFLTLRSHGLLLTPLGFPGPITLSFILWGLWACHQPFTFFTCITSGLIWPILTFLHHILPMSLLLLSLWAHFRPIHFLKAHLFIS